MKPDIFIIGFGKSGTTSLYDLLVQSSNFRVANNKEPNLLSSQSFSKSWYYRHFSKDETVGIIDASPETIFAPKALLNLQHFATAKVILLKRNPIERAYSDWWMFKVSGLEKLNFIEALKENERQIHDRGVCNTLNQRVNWSEYRDKLNCGCLSQRFYLDQSMYALHEQNLKNLGIHYRCFDIEQLNTLEGLDAIGSYIDISLNTLGKKSWEGYNSRFHMQLAKRLYPIFKTVPIVNTTLRQVNRKIKKSLPKQKITQNEISFAEQILRRLHDKYI